MVVCSCLGRAAECSHEDLRMTTALATVLAVVSATLKEACSAVLVTSCLSFMIDWNHSLLSGMCSINSDNLV